MTGEHENYLSPNESPSRSEVSMEYKKSGVEKSGEQWKVAETILQCLIVKHKRNTYRIRTGVVEQCQNKVLTPPPPLHPLLWD